MSRAPRPHGHRAGRQQVVPDGDRPARGRDDLDAALARVARARDQAVDAGDGPVGERERRDVGDGAVQHVVGGRALQRDHAVGGRVVDDRDAVRRGGQEGHVDLGVAGVHDQQVVVGPAAVGDQVVDDPARLVGQQRVLRLAVADPVEVVGQHALQEVVGAGSADLDLSHVRHVEDAGGRPNGPVLLVDARVVDGHVPAAEVDHPGAEREVARVQRCRPRGQHGCLSAQWSGRTGRKHTCVVRGWPGRIRPRLPAGGTDSMRRLATLIGLVLATTLTAPAAAHAAAATLLFPVVGGASYVDDYGDPRPQGHHQGNDLMAAQAHAGDRGRRRRREAPALRARRLHALPAQLVARVALHPPEQRRPRQRRHAAARGRPTPAACARACA